MLCIMLHLKFYRILHIYVLEFQRPLSPLSLCSSLVLSPVVDACVKTKRILTECLLSKYGKIKQENLTQKFHEIFNERRLSRIL